MSMQPKSNPFITNVHKILSTFVPIQASREHQSIYTSLGATSYGTITFSDNKSNRAEFIRVAPDASVMHVKELLNHQWCNGKPSLVISVTGGAKEYNMKPKLLRAFRRGLLKVARTTGAWIITGGMNTGIMKLVGEIVQINPDRSRPIHLIGIATWGCVSGFHQLDVSGSNVHYSKPRSEQKGEAPLEPNHTEFIFVDDGSERKYGREISFRAKLEQAISGGFFSRSTTHNNNSANNLTATQSLRNESSEPVPVVLIVVEGGPNTVRTVHEAVVQNSIPAVFLEGTGRCCDLFAKAYYLYNEYRQKFELTEELSFNLEPNIVARRWEELKNKLRDDLQNEIRAISGDGGGAGQRTARPSNPEGNKKNADKTDYFELVYECLYTRANFLNIISLNARNPVEPDIDLVILQALLNATSSGDSGKNDIQRRREQLHLALEWNRVDIARNFIMKNSEDWEKIDLNDLFTKALHRDQIGFVRLFLDHDFSLTDLFRIKDNLSKLYHNEFKDIPNYQAFSGDPLRVIYKYIIQPSIGDFFEVNAAINDGEEQSSYELGHIMDKRDRSFFSRFFSPRRHRPCSSVKRDQSVRSEGSPGRKMSCLDVDKELFLWSVITGRRDFALLFWSRGKNKICAALIAALIYRNRARKDNDNSYYEAANQFENLAVQILHKFYQTNAYACTKAIIRQIPTYGNVTWLQLAVEANAKDFIAQKSVQDVLNDIWFGYIDQSVSHTAIIFATIMPFFSGFLRYHNELVKLNETDKIDKPNFSKQDSYSQRSNSDRPTDVVNLRLMEGVAEMESSPVDFVDVGCWEKSKTAVRNYFTHITTFMRAPYVKYLYNLYFHLAFLSLFSYLVLSGFFPLYDLPYDMCLPAEKDHIDNSDQNGKTNTTGDNETFSYGFTVQSRPSNVEIILFVWIMTLLCEEIRQLASSEAQSFRSAIFGYFQVFWNKLDVLAIFLFLIAMILRFIPSSECFCAARIILSVDLSIWFIRSLDIFAAVKRLGPKLVMIGEMVHDLKFFTLMLTIFILSFGISTYSLIHGVQKFTFHLPRDIVNLAYWQIFGELNALELFEKSYNPNGYAAFILLVGYMLIVSVLLVNLLIAMFSNTFDRLQNDTDRIWKFQRYSLVCEYLSRPSLPPPLIFIPHLWRLTLFILAHCCKSEWIQRTYDQHSNRTKYKEVLDEKVATNIEIAEDAFGDEVYYNFLKVNHKLVEEADIDEERVVSPQENMLNRIRTLENRIHVMSTQQSNMFDYLECLMDGLKTIGGDRIRTPERRRIDAEESLINTYTEEEPNQLAYYRI